MLRKFWKDEEGLTTVEYALLLALLVVAAIVVWSAFGKIIRNTVAQSSAQISGVANNTAA